MSDYISKSAFIEDIKTEIVNIAMDGLKGTPRPREELYQLIERIEEQPTVDEKEIIHKAFERVVERLEEEIELFIVAGKKDCAFAIRKNKAIKIVEEECGISE